MIKLQELTPQVYYKQSRDFQFIGRLYDIVLNSVKTNAANLYSLPMADSSNEQTLTLLAYTLGFKAKHSYDNLQLRAVCSVLQDILRHKGSLKAFLVAAQAVLGAHGITQTLSYELNNACITLYVSQYLDNLNLLYDLLDYILPVGMSCNIVQELSETHEISTRVSIESAVTVSKVLEQSFNRSIISKPFDTSTESDTDTENYSSSSEYSNESGRIWNTVVIKAENIKTEMEND